jgi:hypothetical protein
MQVMVRLKQGERNIVLPFTLVQAKGRSWLVESVDISPLTPRL